MSCARGGCPSAAGHAPHLPAGLFSPSHGEKRECLDPGTKRRPSRNVHACGSRRDRAIAACLFVPVRGVRGEKMPAGR
ncbi:hypothetical protein SS05631_c36290 [Sinorhizobium sp. CCBAU 05631]|nr:hypothetical protein SS05631_c36290 [Sinorhizobium sp. CCBAU 05631]